MENKEKVNNIEGYKNVDELKEAVGNSEMDDKEKIAVNNVINALNKYLNDDDPYDSFGYSRDLAVEEITNDFFKRHYYKKEYQELDAKNLYIKFLSYINVRFALEIQKLKNIDKKVTNRYREIGKLSTIQMAQFISKVFNFKCVSVDGGKRTVSSSPLLNDVLCIYADSTAIKHGVPSDLEGVYIQNYDLMKKIINKFCTFTDRELEDILDIIFNSSQRVPVNTDPDLIPVNNGIFDYKKKELLKFNPDYVCISKINTNYNPNAKNIFIEENNDIWDIESWMNDLFENKSDEVLCMWQIIGLMIRSNVPSKKVFLFYNRSGNNGKGTICELIRGIMGAENCASTSIDDFNKEFGIEELIGKKAIITDENDVGVFHQRMGLFKSAITREPIKITRKYMKSVDYVFQGNMIQCINELPNTNDISGSMERRIQIIVFNKHFEVGEKSYIKDDYLQRKEVREYVLYKVLTLLEDYDKAIVTESSKVALEEYKESTDSAYLFWNEVKDDLTWDVVPFNLLFSIYNGWYDEFMPSGSRVGRNYMLGIRKFTERIKGYIEADDSYWCVPKDPSKKSRIAEFHDVPEPLIYRYNVDDWKNKTYKGDDINRISTINRDKAEGRYKCIYKKSYMEKLNI